MLKSWVLEADSLVSNLKDILLVRTIDWWTVPAESSLKDSMSLLQRCSHEMPKELQVLCPREEHQNPGRNSLRLG